MPYGEDENVVYPWQVYKNKIKGSCGNMSQCIRCCVSHLKDYYTHTAPARQETGGVSLLIFDLF